MGIEEQIDRLIDLGEDIKSRLDLLFELASDHFAGADKMVSEEPAKEAEPAWEPKIGDWVRVTRPGDWTEWEHPNWEGAMNQFDEKIGKIECEWGDCFQICGFAAPNGFRYQFHRDWLSPAEPPASEKSPEPEYREPVLPADVGQPCEFSMTGKDWYSSLLAGFQVHNNPWISSSLGRWNFARIKKDA